MTPDPMPDSMPAAPGPPAPAGSARAPGLGRIAAVVGIALVGLLALPALLLPPTAPSPRIGLLRAASLSAAWLAGLALVAGRTADRGGRRAALGLGPAHRWGPARWLVAVAGGLALSQAVDLALRLGGAGRGAALEAMLAALRDARGGELVAALLVVGAGAGFAEELFFRGWLQRGLVARLGAGAGIGLAAASFALAHFDPQHAAYAFAFGAYAGTIARWSDSTWPAIAIHAINNAGAVVLAAAGLDAMDAAAGRGALLVALVASLACVAAALAGLAPRPAGLDAGDGPRVGSNA